MSDRPDKKSLCSALADEASKSSSTGTMDRRSLLRGAAAATLGLSASAVAQNGTALRTGGDVRTDYVAAQLHAQTQQAQRWGAATPNNWVRPRRGADHNVVIVGGGVIGSAIAFFLAAEEVADVFVYGLHGRRQAASHAAARPLRPPRLHRRRIRARPSSAAAGRGFCPRFPRPSRDWP